MHEALALIVHLILTAFLSHDVMGTPAEVTSTIASNPQLENPLTVEAQALPATNPGPEGDRNGGTRISSKDRDLDTAQFFLTPGLGYFGLGPYYGRLGGYYGADPYYYSRYYNYPYYYSRYWY